MKIKELWNQYFNSPIPQLVVCGIFFGISTIDSLLHPVYGYSDLFWWGKLAMCGFIFFFGIITVRFFFLPIFFWIKKLIKGNDDK